MCVEYEYNYTLEEIKILRNILKFVIYISLVKERESF